jgi:hypothetical protein
MVTIVELIDPRPYIFQPAVYGRLIYTVICMSDLLLNQANPNPHFPPPPELRRTAWRVCSLLAGLPQMTKAMKQRQRKQQQEAEREAGPKP